MTACPDSSELTAFVDGGLDAARVARLQDHLDGCSSCFGVIALLARGDDAASITPDASSADLPDLAPSWRETRRIAEYRLVRPIGRGSGGQVWLADDTLLDRQVAIKFVSTATQARARERFSVEARAIARLSHPNVVTVHRVGEVDGQPYLVSELVRGKSLDALALPVSWQRARDLGRGLARGLAAAHEAGIVHRDIKPSNAIVGDDGVVKLLDFGLAKLPDVPALVDPALVDSARDVRDAASPVESELPASSPKLTATGHLLGTPLYMAPEAWRGAAPAFAMDIYSLGAVLYELCCGVPPHTGATVGDVRRAALAGTPRAIALRAPGIDPAFARVIAKCLALDPAARFATAAELRAALDEEPAPALPLPATRSRWRHIAMLGALAMVIVAAGATYALTRNDPPAPVAVAPARPPAPAATPIAPQRCSVDRWCWDVSAITALFQVWGAAHDDAWLVGGRGLIRHYDGHTWKNVTVPTVADLYGVSGSGPRDVWIVGLWGTLLHFDGTAWHEMTARTHESLRAVWAHTETDAWIVGERGLALHWDGVAWKQVATPATTALYRIAGLAADDVWAFGYGTALHWDGHAWHETDVHTHEHLGALHIVATNDIWLAGFHSVIRHWNGRDWEIVPVPEAAAPTAKAREDFPLNGGDGVGRDDLWLIAKSGGVLHKQGARWTLDDQHTDRELFALGAIARDDAWAVGTANAVVHWDGRAWTPVTPEVTERMIYGIWGASPRDVWAIGVTRDAHPHGFAEHFDGETWTEAPLPQTPGQLRAISGIGDERYATGDGELLAWRDHAWHREASPTTATISGVWADAPGRAWAVVEDGTILRREATGTWRVLPAVPEVTKLHAIWGARPGEAWAVGEGGALHLQGDTWTVVPKIRPKGEPLLGVWGAAADDVWAVGLHGATAHWDGKTWKSVFSDFDQPLNAVAGWSANDVWAVSNTDQGTNTIIHWNGSEWTQIDRTTHEPLAAVWAVGPDEVWASGWWATMLHHVPGT